jgi:hypothetical protein
MGLPDHTLVVAPLLALLALVLGIGATLVLLITRHLKRVSAKANPVPVQETPKPASRTRPLDFHHPSIRRPTCWLAVKNQNLNAVKSALGLHNPKPCSWAEGFSGKGDSGLFIAPAVSGWTLVTGPALIDPTDDVDLAFRFLLDLSRKLGHVQLFCANLVLNHHAWAKVENGVVKRAYAWSGKTVWNQGAVTQDEVELELRCFSYTDSPASIHSGPPELGQSNADKVRFLAARWSIDPEEIDETFIEREWGIVGEPSRRF